MKILLAFDKFKDAAGAAELCRAGASTLAEEGLSPDVRMLPLTDGGEGFATLLTQSIDGVIRRSPVTGPCGEIQDAAWGVVEGEQIPSGARDFLFRGKPPRRVALVEMAQAAGLEQVSAEQRDPFATTTFGVGQLLAEASREVELIVLGLGGSATNDLGIGALGALGLRAGDVSVADRCPQWVFPKNWPLPEGALQWKTKEKRPPVVAACDVDNPLFGPRGAIRGFGPQKGLVTEEGLVRMETVCLKMAELVEVLSGRTPKYREGPGSGAAGGISWGLGNFLSLRRVSGAELVAAWQEWERLTDWADLVITGEGCVDEGFYSGKGPGALARMAMAKETPVKVLAGKVMEGVRKHPLAKEGQIQFYGLNPPDEPLEISLSQTLPRLQKTLRDCLSS
ncbi:MAG: glycerate kinase [Opitutales bacterium]|nr:glycerate kinase [Opitutales bacterium]MCH8540021.1 glycerate kinase [Opitutales bacterium]